VTSNHALLAQLGPSNRRILASPHAAATTLPSGEKARQLTRSARAESFQGQLCQSLCDSNLDFPNRTKGHEAVFLLSFTLSGSFHPRS
jgi:hypothetical protein